MIITIAVPCCRCLFPHLIELRTQSVRFALHKMNNFDFDGIGVPDVRVTNCGEPISHSPNFNSQRNTQNHNERDWMQLRWRWRPMHGRSECNLSIYYARFGSLQIRYLNISCFHIQIDSRCSGYTAAVPVRLLHSNWYLYIYSIAQHRDRNLL